MVQTSRYQTHLLYAVFLRLLHISVKVTRRTDKLGLNGLTCCM